MRPIHLFILSTSLLLGSCQLSTNPEGVFLVQLRKFCGEAYRGTIVSTDAIDDGWRKKTITMHVRDCSDDEIKIALHVGEDRSRTWILRHEEGRLALRHDHRHHDGTHDAVTLYGGSAETMTPTRITFPADQSTKDMFDRENISESKSNIWAIDVNLANDLFAYEMVRPNRNFRIEFDASTPVDAPPTPWGW